MLVVQSYLVVYSKIWEEGNIKCSENDFYPEDSSVYGGLH